MENKPKVIKPVKTAFLLLFLLPGFGTLSCNNPETQEQQNEIIHEEDEMMHDEHMMEEEVPHEDMMEEDTLHEDMMHGDTLMREGV